MAITAKISASVLKEVNEAKAKIGLLPINAVEDQKVSITAEQVEQLAKIGNPGGIKGLLNAGGGVIWTGYKCVISASHKDAPAITYQRNGVEKSMKVPVWTRLADAEEIRLADNAAPAAIEN